MTTVAITPTSYRRHPISLLAAFIRRDWRMAWSYRLPFVMGLVQTILSIGFLHFLNHLVGPGVSGVSLGLNNDYYGFIVFGTVLVTMFSGTLTAIAIKLRNDQVSGTLEVLFAMPPPASFTVLASSSYQVLYAVTLAAVTIAMATPFGLHFHVSALSALAAVLGTIVSLVLFASLGMVFASYVIVFKRGETLTALVTSALTLLGGVYYPVASLPTALRDVANVLPFTWSVEVIRDGFLGGQAAWARLSELGGLSLVALPGSLWLFSLALRRARRKGTVGQF